MFLSHSIECSSLYSQVINYWWMQCSTTNVHCTFFLKSRATCYISNIIKPKWPSSWVFSRLLKKHIGTHFIIPDLDLTTMMVISRIAQVSYGNSLVRILLARKSLELLSLISLPLKLETNGFTRLPKYGSRQSE